MLNVNIVMRFIMIKYYCDRCLTEVNSLDDLMWIVSGNKNEVEYSYSTRQVNQVCSKCYGEFLEFILSPLKVKTSLEPNSVYIYGTKVG